MAVIVHPNANADSYPTLAEAEAIMAARLATFRTNWDAASDAQKDAALIEATRALDRLCVFRGSLVTGLNHTLAFPRIGLRSPNGHEIDSGSIPSFMKEATTILAEKFLSSSPDIWATPSGWGKSRTIIPGVAHFDYDKKEITGLPNDVKMILEPYCSEIKNPATINRQTTQLLAVG